MPETSTYGETGTDQRGLPTTDRIKERAAEVGRKVVDAVDSGRLGVADRLDGAAQRAEKVSGAAQTTADKLGSMAEYVRENDTRSMMAQAESLVRAHPGKSLLAVAAIGFLTGRALRR